MSKLIIVDGYAILHRAYHALPPLTNRRGRLVNAIYGFVSILLKLIVDLKPTHIAVAFDREEKTFRRKKFENYQTHRKPIDKDLSDQFVMVRDLTKAFNIPAYELAGYESDDIIGTIVSKSDLDEMIIVTGDRDLFQLVNNKVFVYVPSRGLSDAKLYKEPEVLAKMGVVASQIVDYKALVGDSADNYPGISGIGPKTAVDLLRKFVNFENIYKNLDKIPGATANKLKVGKESGRLAKKLATIVRKVPIEIDFEKMDDWDIDSQKVLDLFAEFGFKTLTERVKKVGKTIDQEKQMRLI